MRGPSAEVLPNALATRRRAVVVGCVALLATTAASASAQQPPAAQPAPAQPAPPQPPQPAPQPAPPAAPGQEAAPGQPDPTRPADPPATGPATEPAPPPPPAAAAPAPVAAQPAPPPPPAAPPVDERDWSKRVTVQLGPLALKPIVLVGVYATPYVGDDALVVAGDVAEEGGFRLRRARFGIDGDLERKVRFEVSAEIGSADEGDARIHDGWIGYVQFPFAQVFAGAHEVPFSRSAMTGSGDHALLERPFAVRAMAPQHQVGAHVEGHFRDGLFSYFAGAFNGFRRTDQFYRGYIENYAPLGNRFGGLAYVGRLATEPLGRLGATIEDIDHSRFRFGAGGGYFFSDGGARDVHSVGGDVLVHVAGVHVLGEVLWSRSVPESQPSEPTAQVAEISSFGLVGQAGYMILRRRLGVTVRVELIDPNIDSDDEGDNFVFSGGAAWRILGNENLKLGAEYTHREELFGLVLANDSVTLGLQLQL